MGWGRGMGWGMGMGPGWGMMRGWSWERMRQYMEDMYKSINGEDASLSANTEVQAAEDKGHMLSCSKLSQHVLLSLYQIWSEYLHTL